MKILICYDGSADAEAAVELAGGLFQGASAVVLSVWEGFSEVLARSSAGLAVAALDFEEADRIAEQRARECAEHGTVCAGGAGLSAESRVTRRLVTVWETILKAGTEVGADVIVLGSRGLTGVKSVLLGSVSRGVLGHADCPVMVVPAPDVARQRGERLRRHEAHADEGSRV
jgi:nucleotide-binding universal stress UspA family protein